MMRVLVVGGGIGGLTAALALSRAGASVTLIEREATFAPAGAGIILAPNAVAILAQLGVDLRACGEQVAAMSLRTASGRVLQHLDLAAWSVSHGPSLAFHRAELHRAMVAALPREVDLRLGHALADWRDTGDRVEVELRCSTESFDLLLGADGIHSGVRRALAGEGGVRYSGYTCWRGVCANPGLTDTVEVWGPRGARMGMVPLRAGRLYVFLVASAARRAPAPEWPSGFVSLFGHLGEDCRRVLRTLEEADLMHHDLEELERPRWGRGRVWLLGDAAHAMTPNLGQGAAMAIEDGLVLTRCLEEGDTAAAHARYVGERHARVRRIQIDSRRLGRMAHWRSGPAVWLRDTLLGLVPASVGDRRYLSVVEPGLALAQAV